MTAPRIRAVIVDDEPPARELLRTLMARRREFELVGEAGDGDEAVELIESLRPDLVFLDVQMPELDGFGVLEAVGAAAIPAVVFVTAHDQYALRAFEVHALDYLLKPFDEARFDAAIQHALTRFDAMAPRIAALEALLDQLHTQRDLPTRLPIRGDGRVTFVDVATIDWIEADDKVARLHAGKDVHTTRMTLNALAERLDRRRFVRIHRSTIVNVGRIKEIQPWFQNDYVVLLTDGTRLMTGRAYRSAVKRLMG